MAGVGPVEEWCHFPLGHSRLKNGVASLAYGPGHPYFSLKF
jgi:hypothetical protein